MDRVLLVKYKNDPVGRLAIAHHGLVAFQYDRQWIENGFSISPFSLPLNDNVFLPSKYTFDGLFGVFADSLPDSWGRLLLDRMLRQTGANPAEITALDRLAIVGSNGAGALCYEPEFDIKTVNSDVSLDELAELSKKILESKENVNVDELFARGGSSGGARPKAYINSDGKEWIVKFPYSRDVKDSGLLEYKYSLKAKECGIDMPETRLFKSSLCSGYFGTRRFDRPQIHMISAAALLEIDFERSVADYSDLFKLTKIVTRENRQDIENLFCRMCFNVYANNQDDHLKNFAYLYDDVNDVFRLSPAYDLTYSVSGYGEHSTTLNGKGKDISDNDLIAVGIGAGLTEHRCASVLERIKACAIDEIVPG